MALGAGVAAQAPVRFEVASIRLHPENGDTRVGIEDSDGFVRISNLPLRNVIAIAYAVMPENVAGPAWLERQRFDITATPPTGPRTFLTGRAGLIAGNGRPIADLVPLLSQNVSAPVVDDTALKGACDLKLEWSEELSIFTALAD